MEQTADADDFARLLKRLHLPTMARLGGIFAERAAREGWSHQHYLEALVMEEVNTRNTTRIQTAARRARFPALKTIEEYDFVFQGSIRRAALGPFLDPDFVATGRNLVLSGKSGIGKTHLCIALAYKAIQHGHDARFIPARDLIDELAAASREDRLREATAAYLQPDVLVIDELGYLAHADNAANVMYGVIDGRYLERKPVLITTNKPLSQWGGVLHDPQLAEAIIDRLLERGSHIELGGRSYRTRNQAAPKESDQGATDGAATGAAP
jgi:DNA replication protein DnaC